MTVLAHEPTTAPSVASAAASYGVPSLASSPYITVPRRIVIEADVAPAWVHDVEVRINDLLALEPNWDTYGAQSLSIEHVISALKVLQALVDIDSPAPAIVPTAGRGIQFEWIFEERAVEVRADDAGVHVYVHDDSGEAEGPATSALVSRAASTIGSFALLA